MFVSNYPHFAPGKPTLLPTPERTGAPHDYSGRGVVIAFIDSGFSNHADLQGRVLVHADATTNHIIEQPRVMQVTDLSWHGQMTSVIACGDGRTSEGRYRGVASGAQMVLVKVSSPRWQIKEADILRGLRWVIDTRRRLNIRIVNLSVGGDFVSNDPSHPIYRAIKKLHDAGVVVLAAAGNSGAEMIVPPASSPHAITIGGFNDHNSRNPAEWSGYHNNYGITYNGAIKPDVVTQAVWIPSPILPDSRVALEARWLAPLLNGHRDDALERIRTHGYHDLGLTKEQIKSGDNALRQALQNRINSHKLIDAHHQHVDGTSVSVAIASSIVAQMLEANPALSPEQVSAILSDTARAVPGDPERQGAGRIDAAAAVKRAVESV